MAYNKPLYFKITIKQYTKGNKTMKSYNKTLQSKNIDKMTLATRANIEVKKMAVEWSALNMARINKGFNVTAPLRSIRVNK